MKKIDVYVEWVGENGAPSKGRARLSEKKGGIPNGWTIQKMTEEEFSDFLTNVPNYAALPEKIREAKVREIVSNILNSIFDDWIFW